MNLRPAVFGNVPGAAADGIDPMRSLLGRGNAGFRSPADEEEKPKTKLPNPYLETRKLNSKISATSSKLTELMVWSNKMRAPNCVLKCFVRIMRFECVCTCLWPFLFFNLKNLRVHKPISISYINYMPGTHG